MKTILFIIPYFGKWPLWFESHLVSIQANPTIDWLFFTDCPIPENYPSNCKFIYSSIEELEELFSNTLGFPVPIKNAYKLCDLKPSYGLVFDEHLEGYDYWGFTDIDIIWGNIRDNINNLLVDEYDIISSRKGLISGHFTILKNDEKSNRLFQNGGFYQYSFSEVKMKRFCEGTFSEIVTEASHNNSIKINWSKILCNQERGIDSHQEYYLDRWLWKDGKILNTKTGEEVMYLHFINWKRTMKFSEIEYADQPKQFYISYYKIHYNPSSSFAKIWNRFTNLFDGFYIREGRRIRKLKRKSLKKRVVNKINKTLGWK